MSVDHRRLARSSCLAQSSLPTGYNGAVTMSPPPWLLLAWLATPPAPAQTLETGVPLRRSLEGSGSHVYSVVLRAGQFLLASVVQDGADVAVRLLGPEGEDLGEIDVDAGPDGREPASILAARDGIHRIEVREARKGLPPAGYVLETEEARDATPTDRERLGAERELAEGALALKQGGALGLRRAAEALTDAAGRFDALGEKAAEAAAWTAAGSAHAAQSELDAAVEAHGKALALWRELGLRRREAAALHRMAEARLAKGDVRDALETASAALVLRRDLGDAAGEAETLSLRGSVYSDLGETQRSLDDLEHALASWRNLGSRPGQAQALLNLAEARARAGEPQRALDLLHEVLLRWRELGDRTGEAMTLQDIGVVYQMLGDYRRALDQLLVALPLFEQLGQRLGEATTLSNIAFMHDALGEKREALEFYDRALALKRETGARVSTAYTLVASGYALQKLGDHAEAMRRYQEGLAVFQEASDRYAEGVTHDCIGTIHAERGETEAAAGHFDDALRLEREVGDRQWETTTLFHIARQARGRGDLEAARSRLEEALHVVESQRRQISSAALRATFVASLREVYELYVDVLWRMHRRAPDAGFDKDALEASERARGRTLLDLLLESRADIRADAEPDLLAGERGIQDRLEALLERRVRTPDPNAHLSREIDAVSAELDRLGARLRAASPRYAALTRPEPLPLTEIQARVLDDDTLLLEYWLGEDYGLVWVVTREGVQAHELPGRKVLEPAALEAYELLAAPVRSPTVERKTTRALESLGALVLSPLGQELRKPRLLVVPDGALHLVPFSALTAPDRKRPLLLDHEIVVASSASLLSVLREGLADRKRPTKTLAVIADPVFDAGDERLTARPSPNGAATEAGNATDPLRRAARDAGWGGRLPRLPFTRREANALCGLVPRGSCRKALDFDASRQTAVDPRLLDYRFIHFATHGVLNSVHPELSGLVFSLVDQAGHPVPGFLSAADAFALRLSADMVVLSGCSTALGREVRSEGLVGLSRGFLYAGAPRVLASLWKVDDAATAELMVRLYGGILGREGRAPAAALRAAQSALLKSRRWRSPYYWAAFRLEGEWR